MWPRTSSAKASTLSQFHNGPCQPLPQVLGEQPASGTLHLEMWSLFHKAQNITVLHKNSREVIGGAEVRIRSSRVLDCLWRQNEIQLFPLLQTAPEQSLLPRPVTDGSVHPSFPKCPGKSLFLTNTLSSQSSS